MLMAKLIDLIKSIFYTALWIAGLTGIAIIVFIFVDPNPKWLTNKELEKKIISSLDCNVSEEHNENEKISINLSVRPTKGIVLGISNLTEKILGVSQIPFEGNILFERDNKILSVPFDGEESLTGDERKISKLVIRPDVRYRRINDECLK